MDLRQAPIVAILCCASLASTADVWAQDEGDTVVVISDAQLWISGRSVDRVARGMTLLVEDVDEQWLWVRHRATGWIDKQHVVPVDRAEEHFSASVREDPNDGVAYLVRGDLRYRRGEFDLAAADYGQVIGLQPDFAVPYNNRGNVYSAKGEYDKAIADYDTAIRLDPDYPHAHNNRGVARKAKGQFDEALKDFDQAIALDPDYADAYSNRGLIQNARGRADKAILDFQRCLELDPQHADACNDLAWLLATCPDANLRDGTRAVEYATRACELTAWKNWSFLDTLAAAHAESGDFAQAVKFQQMALKQSPAEAKRELRARRRLYNNDKPFRDRSKQNERHDSAPSSGDSNAIETDARPF